METLAASEPYSLFKVKSKTRLSPKWDVDLAAGSTTQEMGDYPV